MCANYQASTHHAVDTSKLLWRIADKAHELRLQEVVLNREGQSKAKLVPDLRTEGRNKFLASSLATFNKKVQDMAAGRVLIPENDDMPTPEFGFEDGEEDDDATGEGIEDDN